MVNIKFPNQIKTIRGLRTSGREVKMFLCTHPCAPRRIVLITGSASGYEAQHYWQFLEETNDGWKLKLNVQLIEDGQETYHDITDSFTLNVEI